jgi:hypothetical protein
MSAQDLPKLWIDLADIAGGANSVLSRTPALPGVYAWYRRLDIDALRRLSEAEPHRLADAVYQLTTDKHCSDRDGRIPPSYSITLRSSRALPHPKLQALREACQDDEFRLDLIFAMQLATQHLQQPLYIGKARQLRSRIEAHLLGKTELKKRLQDANIDIRRCRLLLLPAVRVNTPESSVVDDDSDSDSKLLLVEDILSRIYQPPFTLRYG